MIFSSLCPFLGIRPPSAFVQRTTSENQTQLSCCLIFGFWVSVPTMQIANELLQRIAHAQAAAPPKKKKP